MCWFQRDQWVLTWLTDLPLPASCGAHGTGMFTQQEFLAFRSTGLQVESLGKQRLLSEVSWLTEGLVCFHCKSSTTAHTSIKQQGKVDTLCTSL